MTLEAPALSLVPPKLAQSIAIASGKGGVGKTWLSVTLAQSLAQILHKGITTANRDGGVLLFDGDLGLANVDIQLGLMPSRDLAEVLSNQCKLADAVMHPSNALFSVIAGRSGAGNLANLAPTRLFSLITELASLAPNYQYVLIDLGAGVDRTVKMLTQSCQSCIVVTTADPTALTDAYAFIKLTYQQDPNADLKVVVNQAATVTEGQKTYDTLARACTNFLRRVPPLLGIVRHDKKVAEAIRAQTPLLTRYPGTAAAEDVMAIARKLFLE
jgi:flagellar biosynthesis protein FlhG